MTENEINTRQDAVTEQVPAQAKDEAPRLYTQEEVDAIVIKRMARQETKLRKQLQNQNAAADDSQSTDENAQPADAEAVSAPVVPPQPPKTYPTMGSMKSQCTAPEHKEFYTVEEARRFSKADFDRDPRLFAAVVRSMQKWK